MCGDQPGSYFCRISSKNHATVIWEAAHGDCWNLMYHNDLVDITLLLAQGLFTSRRQEVPSQTTSGLKVANSQL